MADAKISELTAVTALADTDEFVVNDGGVTKRITAANVTAAVKEAPYAHNAWTNRHDLTSNSSRVTPVTIGPWQLLDENTIAITPGMYVLGPSWVQGCTPPNVLCQSGTTATAGDEFYYVIYNVDSENGMPTTLAASWGPFDFATTGTKTLSTQTESVAAGFYLVGGFAPTGNTSNVSASNGGIPAFGTPTGAQWGDRYGAMQYESSDSTPSSDLSALDMGSDNTVEFVTGKGVTGGASTAILWSYGQTS